MKLNFGCGRVIRKGWINVDIQKSEGIDKSFNFNKFPYPFKNDIFEYILADNVLEHLDDLEKILNELHRISKKGAKIKIIVPYYHCKGAYNDLTHTHFFNETSFDNLINPDFHYGLKKINKKFEIVELKLKPTKFGRLFPFFVRRYASYVLGEIYSEIEVLLNVLKWNLMIKK